MRVTSNLYLQLDDYNGIYCTVVQQDVSTAEAHTWGYIYTISFIFII